MYAYETTMGNKLFRNVPVVHSYNINVQNYVCGSIKKRLTGRRLFYLLITYKMLEV